MPAVRQVRRPLLPRPQLLRHLLLDALGDQAGLVLHDVVEVLVGDLHLERVVEAEGVAVEGVVELVAVVHPALGDDGDLEVEEFVELALLLEVGQWLLGGLFGPELHEVVAADYCIMGMVPKCGLSSLVVMAPIFLARRIVLLLLSFWSSPRK